MTHADILIGKCSDCCKYLSVVGGWLICTLNPDVWDVNVLTGIMWCWVEL
jgi:hypothetical protein